MRLIKSEIREILKNVVEDLVSEGALPAELLENTISLEVPKQPEHGDFATTFALSAARKARKNPKEIARMMFERLPVGRGVIASASVEGPGFLNLFVSPSSLISGLHRILDAKGEWGRNALLSEGISPERINLEFVSANPTGPMHVGHGRGAAVGDSLVRILRFAGHDVVSEYYVNDAGRQVGQLATSIWCRYLELCHEADSSISPVEFPEDGYHGAYVIDMARAWMELHGLDLARQGMDPQVLKDFGVQLALSEIQKTLSDFSVHFDVYTSEKNLHEGGAVTRAMDLLGKHGTTYEQDGALFFAATRFGDEKDRVLVRANGEPTYFAADIAYHLNKFQRGFDRLMDVWGADHHGYVSRVRCALSAFGHSPENFEALLVQFVSLMNQGEKLAMGKRSGNFVTLQELIEEVGADVTRWFFLARTHDVAVDFDLEVARSADPRENPARYVQYSHARACAIFRRAAEWNLDAGNLAQADLSRLTAPEELGIVRQLLEFPELVADAARTRQPHRVAAYALDLGRAFHSYYTRFKEDPILPRRGQTEWDREKTLARLGLVEAYRIVLKNSLNLLGIHAPEAMQAPEEE